MGKNRAHPHSKKKDVTQYTSRTQAVRRLQVSLKDFRRLCILKGIYPREPKKKSKAGNKTFYYTKDIQYLAHEPLLNKFREFKTFLKRYSRAIGRGEKRQKRRMKKERPHYRLDHIIKERYPSFDDALADVDDALCMVSLFASLPQTAAIPSMRTKTCRTLTQQFLAWVTHTQALTKVFVSVKGTYYQAEILGKEITWLVPHKFKQKIPNDVDLPIMLTFLEFHEVLLHFVNYRLYKQQGLKFPPVIGPLATLQDGAMASAPAKPTKATPQEAATMQKRVAEIQQNILSIAQRDRERATENKEMDVDEESEEEEGEDTTPDQEEMENVFGEVEAKKDGEEEEEGREQTRMFADCVFFLSNEIPYESLAFVIKNGGGVVTMQSGPIPHNSPSITHEIVDRPSQTHMFLSRQYAQPQWVFDSFNCATLLPVEQYAPGASLPPHLSPFVNDAEQGYEPSRAKQLKRIVAASRGEELEQLAEEGESDGEQDGEDVEEVDENAEESEEEEDGVLIADEEESEMEEMPESDGEGEESEEENEHMLDSETEEIGTKAALAAQKERAKNAMTEEEEAYHAELEAEKSGKSRPLPPAGKAKKTGKRGAAEEEERELAVQMMSKKQKRLYDRATFGLQKKSAEVEKLKSKAKAIKKKQGAK